MSSNSGWHIWPEPRKRLYRAWLAMRNRCNNARTPDYKYYGSRGIKVCHEWGSYIQFENDMGPHPGPGWTLDRVNNNDNYTLTNCRWATRQTQGRNRNYCNLDGADAEYIRLVYASGDVLQTDIAKQYGVTQVTISQVIRKVTLK